MSRQGQRDVSLAVNPDGTRVATASQDGSVKLWDTVTGEEVLTLVGRGERVTAVVFSPDGARLAIATPSAHVTIWETSTDRRAVLHRAAARRLRGAVGPLVDELCDELPTQAAVIERLGALPTFDSDERAMALRLAHSRGAGAARWHLEARRVALSASPGRRAIEWALGRAERACAAEPENPQYAYTRAHLLLGLNREAEAVAACELAARLPALRAAHPWDLGIHVVACLALDRVDQAAAAFARLEKAMELPINKSSLAGNIVLNQERRRLQSALSNR
jgi:hypothetical protein